MFDPEKVRQFALIRSSKYEERLQNLKQKFEKSTIQSLIQLNIHKKHVNILQSSFKESKGNLTSKVRSFLNNG